MRTVLLLISLTAACAAAPPAAPGELEQPRGQDGSVDSGHDQMQDIRRRIHEARAPAQVDQPGAPPVLRFETPPSGLAPMPFGRSMFGPWDVGERWVYSLEIPERPARGPLPPIPSDD